MASNHLENMLVDGILRGGCLTSAGAAGSSAVVTGLWTPSHHYSQLDIVVPHPNMVAAGGKLLLCIGPGNTGSTNTLTLPNPNSSLADGAVTWYVLSTIPVIYTLYVGLFTVAPSDAGGGTEVVGGSYNRINIDCTLANWSGTQSPGSTTASTGTGGQTSNNNTINFAAPTADWGTIVAFGIYDYIVSGNLLFTGSMVPQTVLNGDTRVTFPPGSLVITVS